MNHLEAILFEMRHLLWGSFLIGLIAAMGIYLTISLKGLQFRYLFHSLHLLFFPQKHKLNPESSGDLSPFQSIMTALAGSIGTGSIAGVAIAISIGGYGAIFWLWVTSIFGMIIAYSENVLAIKYRVQNEKGQMSGGPMYALRDGLKQPLLAKAFALFGAIAAFGIGATVQSNSTAGAIDTLFSISPWITGIIMALIAALVVLGGVRKIGQIASVMVPLMTILYVAASLAILTVNWQNILPSLQLIITSAFTGQAPLGGFVGSSLLVAMQMGSARAVFSNEAGLGSSPIAAANAKTPYAALQGMLAMAGVFVASLIICTMTGLVLAVTDSLGLVDSAGILITGAPLTIAAFSQNLPGAPYIVLGCLVLFGFTTLIAWAYYGEKCIEFLLGAKSISSYRLVYLSLIIVGAAANLHLIWAFADIANGLMCIPNLIGVIGLIKVVRYETMIYEQFLLSLADKYFKITKTPI
ncbi:sodium:alanine symporter family protein [Candidatus Berkiella cookevillensis]|uniref:Amino-acid carrier protein AlsT n=1 Tax=Candidatus Berkiella cookevillensis TaxID=437022 RepID=A0A0Q9YP46_9GAMM|nr:sodium:alanine symporter family protein [Candidatus Berkiella cookevillensis]MCS5708090.1 sodium:alanine symporter family protein [Candidatus Berkiella cookevillensis]